MVMLPYLALPTACAHFDLIPFHPANLVLLLGVDNLPLPLPLPLVPDCPSPRAGHGLFMVTSDGLPTRPLRLFSPPTWEEH